MTSISEAAAVSHVGKVRANNQDSGYAGVQLFVVADGMGGHAGGDVASAIAVQRLLEIDGVAFATAREAEERLRSTMTAANRAISEAVYERPELTGMGTTVSALVRLGDQVVIGHIGDSRVYLVRDGEMSQITDDHTFVQRLVDSGRITPEEALTHPRRSVLMRVLGDVEASPDIDTSVLTTRPGDRWMICSDGLSSYVPEERLEVVAMRGDRSAEVADALLQEALDHGAPDNVTVVVLDVDRPGGHVAKPVVVGSAANPVAPVSSPAPRAPRIPALFHPVRATVAPRAEHFEPDSEDYLDAIIAEDRKRAVQRRIVWLTGVLVVIALVVAGGFIGYRWTQERFYVGVDGAEVAIYQGVQQSLGPIALSQVVEGTGIEVADLSSYYQQQVEDTINVEGRAEADALVASLRRAAGG